MRLLRTTPILMFALLATGVASAMPSPAHPIPDAGTGADVLPSFAELDRNNDGVLDASELPPGHELSSALAQYDRDGDNALSRDEYEMYLRGGDGGIAEAEDEEAGEGDED